MRARLPVEGRKAPLQRGFALVIVLWITTLLAVIAASFAFSMRAETRMVANTVSRARAAAIADAGIRLGALEMMTGDPRARWRADGTPHSLPFSGATLRIAVTAENGKIDLNRAPEELIRSLFSSLPDGAGTADPAGAFVAWRRGEIGAADASGDRRPSESPGRMRLLSVSELGRVPGMTRALVEQVEPMVTVFSGRPYVDPETASRDVLLALPGVKPAAADRFLAARAEQDSGRGPLPLDLLGSARRYLRPNRSNVFSVSAQAELPDRIAARRRAVLRLIPGRTPPYQVLAWFPDEEAESRVPAQDGGGGGRP